jgi:peptide/nickel transport system permease protein
MGVANGLGSHQSVNVRQQFKFFPRIPRASRFHWFQVLIDDKAVLISMLFLAVTTTAALIAPLLTLRDASTVVDPLNRLAPPSAQHWLGTDQIGRDVFARVIYGSRISLLIGVSVTIATALIGTAIGMIAAFFRRLDNILMRIMDGLMAFPAILLAIAITASLGAKPINVIIALVTVNTPRIARLARGSALVISEEVYVEAARAIGLSNPRIIARYILPNSLSPLIVQSTFILASAIIAEASLSFLGAGVPPDIPTWGNMLRDGQRVITSAWWISVFPGMALFVTVLAFNVIGDGLRDALDPRLNER